jgi:hypothetical protein
LGAFVGGLIETDADIGSVVDDAGDPDDPIWVGVEFAWAMRSVSGSGQTQISVDIKKKDAKGPSRGDRIRVDDAQVGAGGVYGGTIVVPDTGLGAEIWGETWLLLDISKAKSAGLYTGIVLEITVENI